MEYPKGMWFNSPSEKAPDFVIGKISISKDSFLEWLDKQQPDEKGYVRLEVLMGEKDGEKKPYVKLDGYKPTN